MKNNQQQYIEYVKRFAEENKIHIWLGGSFLNGSSTLFSDVDISVLCNAEGLGDLIYGYGKPVYISYTHNPLGILIIIYENGVAVDLEIIEKIDIEGRGFFHKEDIKIYNYNRNEKICNEFSLKDDKPYQMSRLFHRSLIKFLAGKKASGVNIANEIVTFVKYDCFIDVVNYKEKFVELLKNFNETYQLPKEYYNLICELIEKLDETNS